MKWIEYTVKVLTNIVWGSVAIKLLYDIAHRKHLINIKDLGLNVSTVLVTSITTIFLMI